MNPTDTSEAGLETLICRALTGSDCRPLPPPSGVPACAPACPQDAGRRPHADRLPMTVPRRFDFAAAASGANPPFDVSDWGGERLAGDERSTFGARPVMIRRKNGTVARGPL